MCLSTRFSCAHSNDGWLVVPLLLVVALHAMCVLKLSAAAAENCVYLAQETPSRLLVDDVHFVAKAPLSGVDDDGGMEKNHLTLLCWKTECTLVRHWILFPWDFWSQSPVFVFLKGAVEVKEGGDREN